MWEKWERRGVGANTRRVQPKSSGIVLFFYSEGEGIYCDVGATLNVGCSSMLILLFFFPLLLYQAGSTLRATERVNFPSSLLCIPPPGFDGIK